MSWPDEELAGSWAIFPDHLSIGPYATSSEAAIVKTALGMHACLVPAQGGHGMQGLGQGLPTQGWIIMAWAASPTL